VGKLELYAAIGRPNNRVFLINRKDGMVTVKYQATGNTKEFTEAHFAKTFRKLY
jgi:hypothetical protein